MKYTLIILSSLFVFFSPPGGKMVGKYRMEFEQEFSSQNCIITFKDSIYERKLLKGKFTIVGEIEYKKYSILLKDKNSVYQMEFAKREIEKDTVHFETSKRGDKIIDNKKIIINSGRLIKMK